MKILQIKEYPSRTPRPPKGGVANAQSRVCGLTSPLGD